MKNQDNLSAKYSIYHLFLHYYNHQIGNDQWSVVQELLGNYASQSNQPQMLKGIEMLNHMTADDIECMEIEFNRLFIGPDKLLAPPYESAYRNPDRVLMQENTLAIREFYAKAGLSVKEYNKIPDDHIAFELEFICYLLHQLASSEGEVYQKNEALYHAFITDHFAKWVGHHCDDILQHSQSELCTGLAMILKSFIEEEQQRIIQS